MKRMDRRCFYVLLGVGFLPVQREFLIPDFMEVSDCDGLEPLSAVAVVMELKVWVDGIMRVVCGLSEQTSCQEVVIALAQAIGQTGRYVLIQKLRDTERQLLANEKPLESLANCGQYANDVQFILRRTGPSASERPSSSKDTQPPERTFVKASLPLKNRAEGIELPKHREPKKSMTFSLGPMGTGDLSPRSKFKQHRQNGGDSRDTRDQASPAAHVSKEDIFKKMLLQQEQLQALESQIKSLESEIHSWERPIEKDLEDELSLLELTVKKNGVELEEGEFWESELQIEQESEQAMQRHLNDLHKALQDCAHKLSNFSSKSESLERNIQLDSAEWTKKSKSASRLSHADPEEALARMKDEIEAKIKQSIALETSLSVTESAVQEAERILQMKEQEQEELNKELRQCNLQQFIQQTGTPVTAQHPHSEHAEQPDRPAEPLPYSHTNGGSPIPNTDSPPRPTAKQFMGNPRNLQNPLVSSLNPEVLSSRETTWR
ncbi:ras association domain-containing protein 8-like isoform X1 [Huso huso]|uniref:Ras association domain-containing protein 8-like isoform X1 n=1 Tax=Huso huso TaxID=61971 RepID=A0ABR0YJI4_HUSHU